MNHSDQIIIRGLSISCHIGVPDEERACPQELRVHVIMDPVKPMIQLQDDIAKTIDYYEVSLRLESVAGAKPRKLIETLAEDFAIAVLDEFEVEAVTVEIEKFILPNTRSVGVKIRRTSSDFGLD